MPDEYAVLKPYEVQSTLPYDGPRAARLAAGPEALGDLPEAEEEAVIANRILGVLLTALAWVVVPVQLVTTSVLGILVPISFGLLLLPLSAIWTIMLFPMLGTSWLCSKAEALRNPLGVLGIPWAAMTNCYTCLIPSMGEVESRAVKLMLTESWPFTWEFWQLQRGRLEPSSILDKPFDIILARVSRGDPVRRRTLIRLSGGEPLDAGV